MKMNWDDYAAAIRQQGFRVTFQRCLILEAISQGAGHSTFDEIWERVQVKAPTLNRATLYRNLNFLCQIRLVLTALINDRQVYEMAGEQPHHHLICRKCGGVTEISHALVETFFAEVKRKCRFQVDADHLALSGVCRQCAEKPAARAKAARAR